MRPNRFEAKCY